MKELTIEEKAKAYDEAAKIIKANLGALNDITEMGEKVVNIQPIKNCFYRAFPELKNKEDEDEKIRKEILSYIKSSGAVTNKQWIAWLEKQGKQIDSSNKEYWRGYYEGKREITDKNKKIDLIEILKHYPKETELYCPLYGRLWLAEVDEKNGIIVCYKHHLENGCTRAILEQEDTISFYSNGTTGLPDCTVSKDCMLFLYKKQDEQKPVEWTEKDKAKLFNIKTALYDYYTKGNAEELMDWIKNHKPTIDETSYQAGIKRVLDNPESYGLVRKEDGGRFYNMLQWTGNNLKEIVDFTGKSPKFDEWFKTWEDFENYVHTHNNIFKIFNEDGSHYEVPVGAWIIKTPDGYNLPSRYVFKQKHAKDIVKTWKDMRLEVYQQASGNRHEPNYSDDSTKMFSLNDIDEIIEKMNEQKPMDKNEPKFHKGEWIAKGDYIWQIVEVKPLHYMLQSQDGNIVNDTISYVDKAFHSFTIEDAKDGDVLVANNGLAFIYNGYLEEQQWPFAYGGINIYGRFNISDGLFSFTHQKVVPATKEQRDLLFQKMKEAGYVWDAEKKELKKIEDKPLVIDEGKDEIDRNFTEMMLKDHTKQKPVPNWRSIDAEYMNKLCEIIDEYDAETTTKCCWKNWLKFLKERVQLQPKQEWSEEDDKMCQETIDWFEKKCFPYTLESENPARESIAWLKSLKKRIL